MFDFVSRGKIVLLGATSSKGKTDGKSSCSLVHRLCCCFLSFLYPLPIFRATAKYVYFLYFPLAMHANRYVIRTSLETMQHSHMKNHRGTATIYGNVHAALFTRGLMHTRIAVSSLLSPPCSPRTIIVTAQ
jgi:hypothetical protein